MSNFSLLQNSLWLENYWGGAHICTSAVHPSYLALISPATYINIHKWWIYIYLSFSVYLPTFAIGQFESINSWMPLLSQLLPAARGAVFKRILHQREKPSMQICTLSPHTIVTQHKVQHLIEIAKDGATIGQSRCNEDLFLVNDATT